MNTWSRGQLAWLAWLGHYPGLWMLSGFRLNARMVRHNWVAGGATIAAMIAGGLLVGTPAVVATWGVGHLLWSSQLAREVYRGTAGALPK